MDEQETNISELMSRQDEAYAAVFHEQEEAVEAAFVAQKEAIALLSARVEEARQSKRELLDLYSFHDPSLEERWKDFQIAVGTWLLALGRKYGAFFGFHSPAPQEETRYEETRYGDNSSIMFPIIADALTQMVAASKITIGAPQSEMEPYQAPAEYEEMLLTD